LLGPDRLTAAEEHRLDRQVQLIDQPGAEQAAHQPESTQIRLLSQLSSAPRTR
jgi:hypothetical protein